MHEQGAFSIPSIRNYVPEKLRPWIIVFFVIVIQFSGGIYLAAVSEMAGSLALMHEDIMMAGYASMVGMALTFTVMFRLKFRFASKTSLLTCFTGLICCNLICVYTKNVPVLVATCFIAGILRMWGTFECNSTVQLWITSKRDLSVFFCYVYLLVQSCIQLSGLTTIYMAMWAKWEYMHWLIIGLLLFTTLLTVLLFRSYRSMKKLPLWGIDWLGGWMWGVSALCFIFICVYGEHYDWLQSEQIRTALLFGTIILALNLWRASFIRHPFIALQTWRYRPVVLTAVLYLVISILLAPSHLFEHIYMESVLGFDPLHTISFNWIVLGGIIAASIFTYFTFARYKWRYKTMTVIAFIAITVHLMYFYFFIDYNLPKESLYIPLFLRSFGYVIIAICFLTSLAKVPFHHFPQSLSIQSLFSAGFGSAFGSAVLTHALDASMKKNSMVLGESFDNLNSYIRQLHPVELYGMIQRHALMISIKEIYGLLTILSLICLLLFMVKESSLRPKYAIHPKFRSIRRYIKHEMRIRKKFRSITENNAEEAF